MNNSQANDAERAFLEALYNHLVLPPQLPHKEDPDVAGLETELLDRLIASAQKIRDASRNIRIGGRLDCTSLTTELCTLEDGMFLVIHINCQNAALFVRRAHDPVFGAAVIFEAFEASAKNEDILAADNALQWDFPGSAVAIPLTTYRDEGFIINLATFIENASRELPPDFAAHAFKAGTAVFEYRNTPDPSLITSMLMGILQENGRRFSPRLLQKMVRDDVCWNNANKPWRRLPFWLVLRVSVQRYLANIVGGEVGRADFKFLIITLLTTFLRDVQHQEISIDSLSLLKTKICRRLVKLDEDKQQSQDSQVAVRIDYLLERLNPQFSTIISKATGYIEARWRLQKLEMAKSIPVLPRRASPDDLRMELRVSGGHLNDILTGFTRPRRLHESQQASFNFATAARAHLNEFSKTHFDLIELQNHCAEFNDSASEFPPKTVCGTASQLIFKYLKGALECYKDNAEQLSLMILTVMELWVAMDRAACTLYPLLRQYNPIFRPDMLDALLMSKFSDMERVQSVQVYIRERIEGCNHAAMTIFADPTQGCFGHRFYEESQSSATLQALHESIKTWAAEVQAGKENEWQIKTREYEDLAIRIAKSNCILLIDDDDPFGGTYHDPNCPRCKLMEKQSKMRIQAFEYPLPTDPTVAKTVVFELACPSTYALYRYTTWHLLTRLAFPQQEVSHEPKCLLKKYQALGRFSNKADSPLGLASTTKSFLATHYSWLSFPVNWVGERDSVCRPNGLRLAYYDAASKSWPARRHRSLGFLHHLKLVIPKSSPFHKLQNDAAFSDFTYGPSSYDVMATTSRCPAGLNIHEFMAFQTMASGKARRWITILAELGSVNVNFSSEAATVLLNHLALQCGPADANGDPLRVIHAIFRDEEYCNQLLGQLATHLRSLSANWRENQLLSTIITFALRLADLASAAGLEKVSLKAISLLVQAREVSARWFKALRAETYQTSDAETAQRCQQYALWAALLCKRTFTFHAQQSFTLDDLSLEIFIQSCIAVQDNLVVKFDTLPKLLQHAIENDLRISYQMYNLVSDSINHRPHVLSTALNEIWPAAEGQERTLSQVQVVSQVWIMCVAKSGEETEEQTVMYNTQEGILLVNGNAIGKLPSDPRRALILNRLFGEQALLSFPSDRPGMQYLLCVRPRGFQVHVGFDRSGNMIVRAFRKSYQLQLIPLESFHNDIQCDLPGPLMSGQFHWLNLRIGEVYITPAQQPWPPQPHFGFTINVHRQACYRTRILKGKRLEDNVISPYSPLFIRAARMLEPLENRREILVVQPGAFRNLQVELRRLQVLFYVNDLLLLQSPQLQCEIDPNQDAGTWYGLRNKLVCRNPSDHSQRTILVPFGRLFYEVKGCHVAVSIEHSGQYGRYQINTILGRLDCAPEPLLVYGKAMLHAYTSSLLPDSLTGRTGMEEAITWLQSGICQPWQPLTIGALDKLQTIAALIPKREYYPTDLRVMRTDHWNDKLPTRLQESRLGPLLRKITQKSNTLRTFTPNNPRTPQAPPFLCSESEEHLHERAILRQQNFERCLGDASDRTPASPTVYQPRDRPSSTNLRHRNVLEISSLVRSWPQRMTCASNLCHSLSSKAMVGGFDEIFTKAALNDRLRVDLIHSWGSLVRFAQQCSNPYSLMFLLGTVAFSMQVDMSLLRTLLAFAVIEELQTMPVPQKGDFHHFQAEQTMQTSTLIPLLARFKVEMQSDEAEYLGDFASSKQKKKLATQKAIHDRKIEEDVQFLAEFLIRQWPCAEPTVQGLNKSVLIELGPALEAVRSEWTRLYHNLQLSNHLKTVQKILDKHISEEEYAPSLYIGLEETYPVRLRGNEIIDLPQLLVKPVSTSAIANGSSGHQQSWPKDFSPTMMSGNVFQSNIEASVLPKMSVEQSWSPAHGSRTRFSTNDRAVFDLQTIIKELGSSRSSVKKRYAADLNASLSAFKEIGRSVTSIRPSAAINKTGNQILYESKFLALTLAFDSPGKQGSARRIEWLKAGNLWPIVTRGALLAAIRSNSTQSHFGSGTREGIIDMAISITAFQREVRLKELSSKNEHARLAEELANIGHENWNPAEHPDWLLLEIEANMMIRPVQIDVAKATISPASGSNSVLQMNMGQGKTSCIIPMAAAALADGKKLVRIIVPKALLQQTADVLQSRLGRMLNRQLRHIPFSRRTDTSMNMIKAYHGVHREIQQVGGIMLCQAEHNLSFMLSGIQRLLDNQADQAGPMLKVQSWLSRVSRDILDESDYTLASDRVAIKDFISNDKPRPKSITTIRNLCPDRPSIKQTVYLLRGLLVNRILMMTLKKRWNVEYGLHPARDPIAVPFHAKGVPSDQSEWGHPDVAIILTCLAFYYDGLNLAQLRQCLEQVLKSDDPSAEYDRWTQNTIGFPSSLKAWNSINVDDDTQLTEIWNALRYSMVVIDHFLNNFVFPKHAKQFNTKIQSNGWDIPLFPLEEATGSSNQKYKPLTTGFSGTNDNRTMLPLTVKQEDLSSLSHTSAEVLTYLLQPRNRECVLPQDIRGNGGSEIISETDLLYALKRRKIRILLDAGAQILEMSNLDLVKQWLKIDETALGALYFDESNKPWIVSTKTHNKTPLLASPFADDLSQCLVYLDEAHTRGTDLKLPADARGALTLRLGQTKDHTVQAAMRLRQLGTTQSVSFIIPTEVHCSIVELRNITMQSHIDSADVVAWLLNNTCDGIEQLQPLYYSQGIDFCRRMQAALDRPELATDKSQRASYVNEIKQEEQQTLQQLYEPKTKVRSGAIQSSSNAKLGAFINELNLRKKSFQDTGRAVHASALQEVEQEREVAFEVETVRQVEKPLRYAAYSFPGLHVQLENFARTGRISADASYFVHMLHSLSKTRLGKKFGVARQANDSRLFVTAEFERTVKLDVDLTRDTFIRPVSWVLWSQVTQTAVIVIPEEAECLIPIMRDTSVEKGTYLLVYSAPTTRKMAHFDDLTYYAIPTLPQDWQAPDWLRVELGLFAGRLYFKWSEYSAICEILGVTHGNGQGLELNGAGGEIGDNGSGDNITENYSDDGDVVMTDNLEEPIGFVTKPLTFMQEWLALRRRGQDFAHSPMGFLTQGKALQKNHAFFRTDEASQAFDDKNAVLFAPIVGGAKEEQDEYDEYHGLDDMGANEHASSEIVHDEVEYEDSEYEGGGE
ncbi:hypothetical protein HJFPF1_09893 [Paramyrothecium foliicola]|nr:hypothetical protein HJFPF1_09893 [Paramyrothecium foliicola]